MAKVWHKKMLTLTTVFLLALAGLSGCNSTSDQNTPENNQKQQQYPPPPPSLSAEPVSISQINLEWSSSGEVNGFIIERSLNLTDGYTQIAETGPEIKSYEDINLKDNTAYYYRIKAYNDEGDSEYSNCIGATTYLAGYGMCVTRINLTYFHCIYPQCDKTLDNATNLTATGTEVFNCLELVLNAPATMIVNFSYHAEAGSCNSQPYLEVKVGTNSQYFYFDCNATGTASISIPIPAGLTINDVSFKLFAGDWGSTVNIHDIVISPIVSP